jgi:hypothetical protein
LKNKENVMHDEFHDKILWDLIKLNHISYLNHDEHPKNKYFYLKTTEEKSYHEIIIP